MRCPSLAELPPPTKTGWPWTEASPACLAGPDGEALPRISIVTPSFNQGPFIEETIRSVLLQGYPDLEYIVIDGGSTDETLAIIRRYAPWLAAWVSEPDRGQSAAINKGAARATGDVIAWVNSDDTLLPGALCRVGAAFARDPALGLVYGDDQAIDSNGVLLMQRTTPEFALEQLLLANWIAQGFVRRAALAGEPLVREDLHYLMDWQLWLRLAIGHRVRRLPWTLSQVRFHSGAKTVRARQHANAEQRRLFDWLYAQPGLPAHLRARRPLSYAMHQYAMAVQAYDAGERPEAFRWLLASLQTSLLRPRTLARLAYLPLLLLPPRLVAAARRWLRHRKYTPAFTRILEAQGRPDRRDVAP